MDTRDKVNFNVHKKIFTPNESVKLFNVLAEIREKLANQKTFLKDEAEWIVAFVLNKKRNEIFLIKNISVEQYKKINFIVKKRLEGIPLNRIFGFEEFYGNKIFINKYVLSPRNETEILVEKALEKLKFTNQPKIALLDLCTGSGAIAIAFKKALGERCEVFASDISKEALFVAQKNAEINNAKIKFINSNLFENFKDERFDMIVSNPPYIKSADIEKLDDEVKKYDPILALDGGLDGLDFYKRIIKNAKNFLKQNGILVLEIGKGQRGSVLEILRKEHFVNVEVFEDFSKIPRVIFAW